MPIKTTPSLSRDIIESFLTGVITSHVHGEDLTSVPPESTHPIVNLYVSSDGKVEVEYDDQSTTGGVVTSAPPAGGYRATNVYVDPVSDRLTVEYDDTPT